MQQRLLSAMTLLILVVGIVLGCNKPVPVPTSVSANRDREVVLRQIGYGLYEYKRTNGRFPALVTKTEHGLSSWRCELLPQLVGLQQGKDLQRTVSQTHTSGQH